MIEVAFVLMAYQSPLATATARPDGPSALQPFAPADSNGAGYVPHRVYDTIHITIQRLRDLLADLKTADVVFLGEQHDDPGTHRLEVAVLEGLARRRSNVVLALEMFERDVQPSLEEYLRGSTSEPDFLAASRPWLRYGTDYRPMVEFARAWHWRAIAGNVPRRIASLVARRGLEGLDSLTSADRSLVARDIHCPHDEYFDRFAKTIGDMTGHSGAGATEEEKKAALERVYQAQCVKDETKGEAIATAFVAAPPRVLVVQVSGAFHSNFRSGTASRAQQRLPGKRIVVVTFVPVADLDVADGAPNRRIGDYIVFTLAPATSKP